MTAVRTLMLAAALGMGFAGSAFARNPVFTAALDGPAPQERVIAQSTVWNCEGERCVARAAHDVSVRSCRQLVRELGARVTAYGTEDDQLTPEEIARCNGEAPPVQQARN